MSWSMGTGKLVHLNDDSEWEAILAESKEKGLTLVVDFFATWCGPCKMIAPEFEKLCGEFTNVLFVKVDVDECENTAAQCGISAMPTFQVYKAGARVGELRGANGPALGNLVRQHAS